MEAIIFHSEMAHHHSELGNDQSKAQSIVNRRDDFLLMYCKNQQDLIIYQTWEKALYFGSRGFDNASIFAANAIISNLEINDFVYRKHCTHKSKLPALLSRGNHQIYYFMSFKYFLGITLDFRLLCLIFAAIHPQRLSIELC